MAASSCLGSPAGRELAPEALRVTAAARLVSVEDIAAAVSRALAVEGSASRRGVAPLVVEAAEGIAVCEAIARLASTVDGVAEGMSSGKRNPLQTGSCHTMSRLHRLTRSVCKFPIVSGVIIAVVAHRSAARQSSGYSVNASMRPATFKIRLACVSADAPRFDADVFTIVSGIGRCMQTPQSAPELGGTDVFPIISWINSGARSRSVGPGDGTR